MKRHTPRLGRTLTGLLLGSTLVLSSTLPAFAEGGPTDVTITGGNLVFTTAPTVGNLTPVTLNGSSQTTTGTITAFGVRDDRGSGAGWRVTISASQFKEHDGTAYVVDGKTLPADALAVSPLTLLSGGGGIDQAAPPTLPPGSKTLSDTPVVLASAALNQGMGTTFGFDESTLTLTVPATAYAATYQSEVTIDVVTAP